MDSSSPTTSRSIGLWGATGVGVGAIVGGGILALAGTAFATSGPSAILAFALNGVIAMLTALSFAEMASKFPESGGTYVYSKKVLSVEVAFTVGWVVLFASIVAAVLYAIGFASFALIMVVEIFAMLGQPVPEWLVRPSTVTGIAMLATLLLGIWLTRSKSGGGMVANIGKLTAFTILIAVGLWAVSTQAPAETSAKLKPFFTAGFVGLLQAMGYSFIALQGFDLIAAVAGEVREPARTLPRAMILSLAIALTIYLPMLFVLATVGTPTGENIANAAALDPEGIVATAARNFMGGFGYWLVIVAAVLSMLSALQANLYASSRIATAMARDRTLPATLSRLHLQSGNPVIAIGVTVVLVCVLLFALRDVARAGAAASLIFLLTFALAHWISILVRERSLQNPPLFRVPFYPWLQVIGGLACLGLALFQGVRVPAAGLIVVVWLGLGGILFLGIFANRARIRDASNTAMDPEVVTLRGRAPLVLVPLANPHNAQPMIALASVMVPSYIGRVLLQNVVVVPDDWNPDTDTEPVDRSHQVLRQLLTTAYSSGIHAEAISSVATQPMLEIARVAKAHRCSTVVLGLSDISDPKKNQPIETLIGSLNADVVALRSQPGFSVSKAKRILVPAGGKSGHKNLRARLLASLVRTGEREINYIRVVKPGLDQEELKRLKRQLSRTAHDEILRTCQADVVEHEDPIQAICEAAEGFDLIILGVQRHGRRKLFGTFARQLSENSDCPILVLSSRG